MLARNYSGKQKWIIGKINKQLGEVIFLVETEKGVMKRHIDQLLQQKLKKEEVKGIV